MNYTDITFIIPLRCESKDRIRNLYLCLLWLNKKYNSPVIVKENNNSPLSKNVCSGFNNVTYIFEESNDKVFHRTRLLNDMIDMCETTHISNFDCDVILPTKNLDLSLEYLNTGFDFVYPYGFGPFQKRIQNSNWEKFKITLNLDDLVVDPWTSAYGHCFIAKTESYKKAFGENEEFISYGPEDYERYFRFKKLGYQVCHLPKDYYVYHIEHVRTFNSCESNPQYQHNLMLNKKLESYSSEETINYYKSLFYVNQRKYNL